MFYWEQPAVPARPLSLSQEERHQLLREHPLILANATEAQLAHLRNVFPEEAPRPSAPLLEVLLDTAGKKSPSKNLNQPTEAQDLANELRSLGFRKGQTLVMISSDGRQKEWRLVKDAVRQLHGRAVGISPNLTADQTAGVFGNFPPSALIVESPHMLNKVPEAWADKLNFIIIIENTSSVRTHTPFEVMLYPPITEEPKIHFWNEIIRASAART
jgi:hypothetical protein